MKTDYAQKTVDELTSKAGQRIARAACKRDAVGYTLEDVYTKYSNEKAGAFNYCRELCAALNGYNFRIISANTFVFSVFFEYVEASTGALCGAYITRDYDRFCYL